MKTVGVQGTKNAQTKNAVDGMNTNALSAMERESSRAKLVEEIKN